MASNLARMEFEPISFERAHRYGGISNAARLHTLHISPVRHFVQDDSMALLIAPDATDALIEVGVAEWPGVTDIVHMSPADTHLDEAGRALEIFLDMLDATFAANHTYLLANKCEGASAHPTTL